VSKVLIITLLVSISSLFVYAKTFKIAGKELHITVEKYNEYGEKGELAKIVDKSGEELFSFLRYERGGECGKRDFIESNFKIQKDRLILYTKYHGYNINGVKKSIFKFNEGRFEKLSSILFIKDKNINADVETIIESNSTKRDLYIRDIQESYKGRFVTGDRAEILKKEVFLALNRWGKEL
jgi:hypothetical protein